MALNERNFKNTLFKVWEKKYPQENLVAEAIKRSEVFFEYTSIFTRREWNTYSAVLHLKTPLKYNEILENRKSEIFIIAESLFGKQDDYYLTDISIDLLVEEQEIIDFTQFGKTETTRKALEDAEKFMQIGRYSSAVDRVHTLLYGYFRLKLEERSIYYEESDTIMQLYSKLHNSLDGISNNKIKGIIKTSIRSASGVIDALNTIRNKHSLSHPNEDIIDESEAKLAIGLCKYIVEYIEERV